MERSDSIEHMPPKTMFSGRQRPNGLEFAACTTCNKSTSPADAVAGFFARLGRDASETEREEIKRRSVSLRAQAPGVIEELTRDGSAQRTWERSKSGLLTDAVSVTADGPLVRGHLNVFASKLGIALFREHVGTPLIKQGKVYSVFFLNSGLAQRQAEKMLSAILPSVGTLPKSGKSFRKRAIRLSIQYRPTNNSGCACVFPPRVTCFYHHLHIGARERYFF